MRHFSAIWWGAQGTFRWVTDDVRLFGFS